VTALVWQVADPEPALLGESPFWHPEQQCLYYCDIAAHQLRRFDPATQRGQRWQFETELASCAPYRDGTLLLAMRDGLWRFDPADTSRTLLAAPPYDPAAQRFNDGKCDAAGRFWVGTLDDQRRPLALLYCYSPGQGLHAMGAQGATVVNGLAWSPDAAAFYWSDTTAHTIYAQDTQTHRGPLAPPRAWVRVPPKQPGHPMIPYAGRPDGAAVDGQGNYWVAMFEGQRLRCYSPQGQLLRELPLPVRCPTMPCFGGPDLRTLYLTTSRHARPAAELAAQPQAGCVLQCRVENAGLPVNFCANTCSAL
jgi:sugar lactone lactonase YvrE